MADKKILVNTSGITQQIPTADVAVAEGGLKIGTAGAFTVGSDGDLDKIKNVAYSWPASQGAASTVLQNNGSGTLSWAAAGGGMSIGGAVTSGTVGSVLFVGAGSTLAQDNVNLFWDDTNNRLGIGTTTPSLQLQTSGDVQFNGVRVGRGAGNDSTNTAVGNNALPNASSVNNVALGTNAGQRIGAGSGNNVCVGSGAGGGSSSTQTATANVFIGTNAGQVVTTGSNNIGIGTNALNNLGIGGTNVAVGDSALVNLTGGSHNVAVGSLAGRAISSGERNVAVGRNALSSSGGLLTGSANTVIGDLAGAVLSTAASDNVIIGSRAGQSLTVGSSNVIIGEGAYRTATGSSDAVVIGYLAADQVTAASAAIGVAIGRLAARTYASSSPSVVVGPSALNGYSGTGGRLTVIGTSAASNLSATGAAEDMVVVGDSAQCGQATVAGVTARRNTVVGASAGTAITTGANITLLGYDAEPSAAAVNNEITLGNASVTTLRCAVTTITAISDARDKADVADLSLGIDFLNTLRPVQYRWDRRDWYENGTPDGSQKTADFEAGFIAQELDTAQNNASAEWLNLVLKSNPDRLEATPGKLLPIVVKACQQLHARLVELEARLAVLESKP